jgi:hypothetical protein
VEVLVRSSDRSAPPAQFLGAQVSQLRANDVKNGRRLEVLPKDSQTTRTAYEHDGHLSKLVPILISQTITEILCPEEGCKSVSRSFEHNPYIYLDFPAGTTEADYFDLVQLLDQWKEDTMMENQGHLCERSSGHAKARELHRRITMPADIICFVIRRSAGPNQPLHLNYIGLPDTLDLTSYCDPSGLPSNSLYGDTLSFDKHMRYRLRIVNHYRDVGRHYILYADMSTTEELGWVMFDDTHNRPSSKSFIEGTVHGEVVHYAIYVREKAPTPPGSPQKTPTPEEQPPDPPTTGGQTGQENDFQPPPPGGTPPPPPEDPPHPGGTTLPPPPPLPSRDGMSSSGQRPDKDQHTGTTPPGPAPPGREETTTETFKRWQEEFGQRLTSGSFTPPYPPKKPGDHERPETTESTTKPPSRRRRFSDGTDGRDRSGPLRDDGDRSELQRMMDGLQQQRLAFELEKDKAKADHDRREKTLQQERDALEAEKRQLADGRQSAGDLQSKGKKFDFYDDRPGVIPLRLFRAYDRRLEELKGAMEQIRQRDRDDHTENRAAIEDIESHINRVVGDMQARQSWIEDHRAQADQFQQQINEHEHAIYDLQQQWDQLNHRLGSYHHERASLVNQEQSRQQETEWALRDYQVEIDTINSFMSTMKKVDAEEAEDDEPEGDGQGEEGDGQ